MTATIAERGKGAAVLETLREAPLGVKTVLAGVFINRLGGFLNVFLVLYLTARGFSPERAALALGAYGAGALVGVFVGGVVAGRLGARNATVLSMASASVLTASLLYLPNYPTLLAAAVLVGLGGQLYRPASTTLLSELTPDDRQIMVFGMHRFGLNLGAMAAPLLGYALFSFGGHHYDLLFWAESLVAAAYAVLARVALPANISVPADERKRDGEYRVLMRDRRFLVFLFATLVHTAVYAQYLSTLPLDMTASGIPAVWYTLVVSLNALIVIACELPLTRVTQRWPFPVTIGLAFGLLGLGVAGYGLPPGPVVAILATTVWSVGEIIGGPSLFAYPAVVAPRRHKAGYVASFQLMFGAGTAIGPMIGGVLFGQLGHHVWPVLAIGSLVATTAVLVALRKTNHNTRSE